MTCGAVERARLDSPNGPELPHDEDRPDSTADPVRIPYLAASRHSDVVGTLRVLSTRQRGGVTLPRMTYDRAYWEQLWAKTLREHPEKVAQRPPNAHLIAEVANLRPGRSLALVVIFIVWYLKITIEAHVESFAPLGYSAMFLVLLGSPLVLALRALRGQTIRYAISIAEYWSS